MFIGKVVSIQDMMACREQRAALQTDYRLRLQKPVLSFCMNIPGPIKTTSEIKKAFDTGCREISQTLQAANMPIADATCFHKATGDEWVLCVDGDPVRIKELMTNIEERHPLGRLFDIDVLDANGNKLSRPTYRKCLLCDEQAQVCARSRRHSLLEMQAKIEAILQTPIH